MKAIVVREFGEPNVMRVEDVQDPIPGQGEMLIRIKAVGVNPVDHYIRQGVYARKPTLPYTPGADAAGTIETAGAEVAGFSPGQRVYITGTAAGAYGACAELAVCEPSQVHPLPDSLSFEQGAAIGVPYGTASRALFQRAQARPGESVLIHGGSGGVGTAAIQLARAAGMVVLATAGTDRGLAHVTAQGATCAFNHRMTGYVDRILEATGGRGVDIILEMLANVNLNRDLGLLGRGGRVIVIGNRGTIEIDPRQAMARDADIRGMILFNASPAEIAEIHAALGAGLRDGTLRPVVGRLFALADAPRAHETVMSPGAHGKIVLTV
ncbi:MAG TPA: NADPH:quinone reductase [Vicinamibacterales bacterium]